MRNALGESKEEIQYKALTKIPEELLLHIPPSFSNFSLFQGFQAMKKPLNWQCYGGAIASIIKTILAT